MNAYRFARRAQSRLGALLVAALMLALTAGVGSASAQRASASAGISARDGVPAVGLLARGSGYAGRTGSPQVRALQRRLRGLDDNPGAIDGLYGPLTQAAVERFQATHGLAVDGIAGPQTQHVLRRARAARTLTLGTGYDTPGGSTQVRALQHHLHAAGQHPGPIDGLYGPQTQAAVEHYQTTHHLTADGIAGPQTKTHLTARSTTHVTARTPTRATQPARPLNSPASASLAEPASGADPTAVLALVAGLLVLGLIGLLVLQRARRPAPAARAPAGRGGGTSPQPAVNARDAVSPHGDRIDPSELAIEPLMGAVTSAPRERPRAEGGDVSGGLPVLGYVLARDSEGHDGDAFRLQAEAIDHACAGRGLQLVGLVRDCESENGGSAPPPGLNHALERVGAGEAGGLVVARLEDLGTSTAGLGALIEWLANPDARLVAADLDLDTGTETGRLATLLSLSELERRRLAAPTREDMAGSQLFPGGRGALRPVRDDGDDEHSAGGEQTRAARYKRPAKKPPRDHHADSLGAEDETAGREEGESWAR